MAADHHDPRVLCLDGVYANLTNLGLPFALSGELQSRNLRLESSKWTVRLTNTGFSISQAFLGPWR